MAGRKNNILGYKMRLPMSEDTRAIAWIEDGKLPCSKDHMNNKLNSGIQNKISGDQLPEKLQKTCK